jgi:CheY-like chemotaxis protein
LNSFEIKGCASLEIKAASLMQEEGHMPPITATLLIVDDDHSLLTTLSAILAGSGYCVRSAEDGFSALAQLRNGIPDIILSDLNMPGMSGFELLSVVRRRFPAVQAIAMSGAHSGDKIPPGVAAEAFYAKGTNLAALLRVVKAMSLPERAHPLRDHNASAPIWIMKNGNDASGKPFVVIPCPECLRTFAQVLDEAVSPIHQTMCIYCHSLIYYAIVPPTESEAPASFRGRSTLVTLKVQKADQSTAQ